MYNTFEVPFWNVPPFINICLDYRSTFINYFCRKNQKRHFCRLFRYCDFFSRTLIAYKFVFGIHQLGVEAFVLWPPKINFITLVIKHKTRLLIKQFFWQRSRRDASSPNWWITIPNSKRQNSYFEKCFRHCN